MQGPIHAAIREQLCQDPCEQPFVADILSSAPTLTRHGLPLRFPEPMLFNDTETAGLLDWAEFTVTVPLAPFKEPQLRTDCDIQPADGQYSIRLHNDGQVRGSMLVFL